MHSPKKLQLEKFSSARDPLVPLTRKKHRQAQYLRCYLHDLRARAALIEPSYFDRDYLSEFEAFYATSTAGYPNVCSRVHYFSIEITRALLEKAIGGDREVRRQLQEHYLGHIIFRPIPGAPIGRTVLRLYPDDPGLRNGTPRVMKPARQYESHVAGMTLRVQGIAWQQQDTAVGSCATVALWSMLHSSAFDDHHAIPTTAEITTMGHSSAPNGGRIFPDSGLQLAQVLEVIKGHDLAPQIITGEREQARFS